MIRHHPSAAALAVHVVGEVADWEVREVLDEAAWDAAHELAPYHAEPGGQPATDPMKPLNSTCCGRKLPGVAGAPLVNACQLCPNSPTYWRNQPAGADAVHCVHCGGELVRDLDRKYREHPGGECPPRADGTCPRCDEPVTSEVHERDCLPKMVLSDGTWKSYVPARTAPDPLPAAPLPDHTGGLDWHTHKSGDPMPCRICRRPALMRDADGRPCHKVCAEQATQTSEGA
jgi:hypothetical protein